MRSLFALLFTFSVVFAHSQTYKTLVNETFETGVDRVSQTPANNLFPGTSDYNPRITINPGLTDGEYAVAKESGRPTQWQWGGDHTAETEYMMIINANRNKRGEAVGTYYLYKTNTADMPGATYTLSFWAGNIVQLNNTSATVPGHIGVAVRNTPDNTGTIFNEIGLGKNRWELAKTTSAFHIPIPWERHAVDFTLPIGYNSPQLYFNFFNSDPIGDNDNGNDIALDDILIQIRVLPLLSGKVFIDKNGNNIEDPGEDGINGPAAPLFAYATDNTGKVISKVPVAADGSYQFVNELPYATGNIGLSIVISSSDVPIGTTSLTPSFSGTYLNLGETVPPGATATTGAVDGKISLTATSVDMTNINFSIEQAPTTAPVTNNQTGAPRLVNLGGSPILGTDPEDQPSSGSWTAKSLTITTVPTNGFILKYEGTTVLANTVIPNYDPALLTIEPSGSTPGNITSTQFDFTIQDAAGISSPSATYTVNFAMGLPVVFGNLDATINRGLLNVNFSCLSEKNNDYFIIEASKDGKHFTEIGQLKSTAPEGTSDSPTSYLFTQKIQDGLALGGLLGVGLFSILLLASKRNRKIFASAMIICGVFFISCKKGKNTIDYSGDVFIRVVQVDKNGDSAYSKVIKAVKE